MSMTPFKSKNAISLLIILIVATLRTASFLGAGPLTILSPIGAMALFGGAYFRGNIRPLLFPLLTLFVSDLVVSFFIFPQFRSGLLYSGWYWTYAAFALMALASKLIITKVSVRNVFIAVMTATCIHWIVSDIGMCVQSNEFSAGLYIKKLIDAIPYELRFFAGTGVFSILMFGGFELLQKKFPRLYINRNVHS